MGGAAATAANMPQMMQRPGGVVFSHATLAAALWASYVEAGPPTIPECALLTVCFLAGVAGRLFVPTNPTAIKLLSFLGGAETAEAKPAGKEVKKEEEKPATSTQDESSEASKQEVEPSRGRPSE